MSATKEQNHDAIEAGMRKASMLLKESPLLYGLPMVKAVLADDKSQTRRLTKLEKINQNPDDWKFSHWSRHTINRISSQPTRIEMYAVFEHLKTGEEFKVRCPYGDKKGDLIWVRETHIEFPAGAYNFKTDSDPVFTKVGTRWTPSIHMPKAASRIWLELQGYNMERLQNISHSDALAEGVITHMQWLKEQSESYNPDTRLQAYPVTAFSRLWDSINNKPKEGKPDCSWDANPWVWVVKFKVLSTTGKPAEL